MPPFEGPDRLNSHCCFLYRVRRAVGCDCLSVSVWLDASMYCCCDYLTDRMWSSSSDLWQRFGLASYNQLTRSLTRSACVHPGPLPELHIYQTTDLLLHPCSASLPEFVKGTNAFLSKANHAHTVVSVRSKSRRLIHISPLPSCIRQVLENENCKREGAEWLSCVPCVSVSCLLWFSTRMY